MMGPPEGAEEYLSMYDALCDVKKKPVDAPGKKSRRESGGGGIGGIAGVGGSSLGGGSAASVPRSTVTSERLYAWWGGVRGGSQ